MQIFQINFLLVKTRRVRLSKSKLNFNQIYIKNLLPVDELVKELVENNQLAENF